jgi:hypothetical protein
MSNVKARKRPCGICRKWFLPDVRQKGRQKTCSAECSNELHRRQCAKWNKKNSAYFKSNYLSQKIDKISKLPAETSHLSVDKNTILPPPCRVNLNLPRDVICNEVGGKNLIIIEYLVEQIICRMRINSTGFR